MTALRRNVAAAAAFILLGIAFGCASGLDRQVVPPRAGEGACLENGTWSFGNPADPANHADFLAFADTLRYRPTGNGAAQKALPVAVPDPNGGISRIDSAAVDGVISPQIGIEGTRPEAYEPGHTPCPGRVIGRVTIDGRESPFDSLREEAERARQIHGPVGALQDAPTREDAVTPPRVQAQETSSLLPDSLALLGGYKSFIHEHGSAHPTAPNERHVHRYYPEGVSYVWVDSVQARDDGSMVGRAVIVSEHTNIRPWVLTLRYCDHGSPAAPGCDLVHDVAAMDDDEKPYARWLDIPEDDHTWEWCASMGCCIVESGTSFEH